MRACIRIRLSTSLIINLRALEAAAMGGHGGIAGADIPVPGGAGRHAVAPGTAGSTGSVAHVLPRC